MHDINNICSCCPYALPNSNHRYLCHYCNVSVCGLCTNWQEGDKKICTKCARQVLDPVLFEQIQGKSFRTRKASPSVKTDQNKSPLNICWQDPRYVESRKQMERYQEESRRIELLNEAELVHVPMFLVNKHPSLEIQELIRILQIQLTKAIAQLASSKKEFLISSENLQIISSLIKKFTNLVDFCEVSLDLMLMKKYFRACEIIRHILNTVQDVSKEDNIYSNRAGETFNFNEEDKSPYHFSARTESLNKIIRLYFDSYQALSETRTNLNPETRPRTEMSILEDRLLENSAEMKSDSAYIHKPLTPPTSPSTSKINVTPRRSPSHSFSSAGGAGSSTSPVSSYLMAETDNFSPIMTPPSSPPTSYLSTSSGSDNFSTAMICPPHFSSPRKQESKVAVGRRVKLKEKIVLYNATPQEDPRLVQTYLAQEEIDSFVELITQHQPIKQLLIGVKYPFKKRPSLQIKTLLSILNNHKEYFHPLIQHGIYQLANGEQGVTRRNIYYMPNGENGEGWIMVTPHQLSVKA